MFGNNHHALSGGYRSDRAHRMTQETEEYLNRKLARVMVARHRGDLRRDPKTDPRPRTTDRRMPDDQSVGCGKSPTVGTLVAVPTDEQGQLDDDLLDRWGLYLARLMDLPQRGHVMLDLAEVVSVPRRFLRVYAWLRRHLADQDRHVLLQLHGACLDSPEPDELVNFLKIDG